VYVMQKYFDSDFTQTYELNNTCKYNFPKLLLYPLYYSIDTQTQFCEHTNKHINDIGMYTIIVHAGRNKHK